MTLRKSEDGNGAQDRRENRATPAGKRGQAHGWGGRRPGAGRKPKGEFAEVSHGRRPTLKRGAPVLITLELARGLPSLCVGRPAALLAEVLREADGRFGMVLLAHSLHPDHLHLIVRARDRLTLSRGMTGLCVRTARALNGLWERGGPVFADRYETRALLNARELRGARRFPCAWRRTPEAAGPHRLTACTPQGGAPLVGKDQPRPNE